MAIGGPVAGGSRFCIYNPVAQSYAFNRAYQDYGAAISGDGHIAGSEFVLTDGCANVIGRLARPSIYYSTLGGSNDAQPNLQMPQLNDSGGLYYMGYPNFIDIIDVGHALLRLRFALMRDC